MHRNLLEVLPPHASALSSQEIATHEGENGQDFIVIRRKDTGSEVYRFALPKNTIFVGDMGLEAVDVVLADSYIVNIFNSGKIQSYALAPGGSLERSRYSYDGREAEVLSVVKNNGTSTITAMISLSGKYVSTVETKDGISGVTIYDLATGKILFATDTTELHEKYAFPKVALWSNDNSVHWVIKDDIEVLGIGLQSIEKVSMGQAVNAIVDTRTWALR